MQDREDRVGGVTLRQAQNRKGLFHLMNETINPGILSEYIMHPALLDILKVQFWQLNFLDFSVFRVLLPYFDRFFTLLRTTI